MPDRTSARSQRQYALETPFAGEPYDIGHLIAFLASPLARYINGAAIAVDGGAVRRAL